MRIKFVSIIRLTKNRRVLPKIIDIFKLCRTCNLALRDYDEKKGSLNKGVFLELADFVSPEPLLILDSYVGEHPS